MRISAILMICSNYHQSGVFTLRAAIRLKRNT